MNKQKANGIEWTQYTWNPISGCKHACRWRMPDGSIAQCYAETVATGIARSAYPQGFDYHYNNMHRLSEPAKVKEPVRIFCDSMSDLFGAWVNAGEIQAVFRAMENAPWHTFQSLTKAPMRLLEFNGHFPKNLWAGVSVPPTFFRGHELGIERQTLILQKSLDVLSKLDVPVRWLSIEPLSWDISPVLEAYPGAIQWAVVGAASNGRTTYQPEPEWIKNVLAVLDAQNVPVFFKGNMRPSQGVAFSEWREYYPQPAAQAEPAAQEAQEV